MFQAHFRKHGHAVRPFWAALCMACALTPAYADSDAQRHDLAVALRQLELVDRMLETSSRRTDSGSSRYHFDYARLRADLATVRAGIAAHLSPSRAQPRDLSELPGDYSRERRK